MKRRYFAEEENQEVKSRAYWFFGSIVVFLLLYLIRAYSLQIDQGHYFKTLSDNNRTRVVPISASRGVIYDRHGTPLVNNIPAFNLYMVREDMPDPNQVLNRLAALIPIDNLDLIRQEMMERKDPFSLIKLKGSLSFFEVAQIEGHLLDLPGIRITAELKRNAIYGPLAAHSLGYIGEVSKAQMDSGRYPDVYRGDMVGQFGVEKTYDSIIRGVRGEKWIEVDVLGQELNLLRIKEPVEGNNLFTTLDLRLQKIAEEALGEAAGSIIAMDPQNGEILAMVSHPSFDPNLLSEGATPPLMKALLNDSSHPLINRSIQGQYAPGSTFKIVLAVAAVETKEMLPTHTVECRGTFPFGNRIFQDWKKKGHGSVDLHRAIVESCDVFFYQTGSRLGIDMIAKFSNLFGLGRPTGIGLAFEKPGLIPSTAWKQRALKEPWYPGETLSVAIGQGYVLVTPLQMAVLISAVANDGIVHVPKLFQKSRDRRTGAYQAFSSEKGKPIPVAKETLETIKSALVDVVATPHGTAAGSRSTLVSFAGKTGTAQVIEIKDRKKRKKLQKAIDDHAWFVSYAPVTDPKIAVVVLVEHGGHGSSAAAPLAKKMIEAYLSPSPLPPLTPSQVSHPELAKGEKEQRPVL